MHAMTQDATSDSSPHPGERPISTIRLTGGRACLDFVNTIDDRLSREVDDYIATPERYIVWSRHAGLIDAAEHAGIDGSGNGTGTLMEDVGALRNALYEIFMARVMGQPVPVAAIRLLDLWLHRAWSAMALQDDGILGWDRDAIDAWLPLKRIALSALDLLQEPDFQRVKLCAAPDKCGWLFFDTSKNNSRRWCAMETCGTAYKMARYREKIR
jgi:predicted RNA-binding Zn ribbon-like protein